MILKNKIFLLAITTSIAWGVRLAAGNELDSKPKEKKQQNFNLEELSNEIEQDFPHPIQNGSDPSQNALQELLSELAEISSESMEKVLKNKSLIDYAKKLIKEHQDTIQQRGNIDIKELSEKLADLFLDMLEDNEENSE